MTSIDKLYIETIFSKYHVIAKDIKRNLERQFKYGKNLENYSYIEKQKRMLAHD